MNTLLSMGNKNAEIMLLKTDQMQPLLLIIRLKAQLSQTLYCKNYEIDNVLYRNDTYL